MQTDRRDFLKLSMAGAAALSIDDERWRNLVRLHVQWAGVRHEATSP